MSGASEAFTGTQQFDECAEEEIRKFMGEHVYEAYQVVNRTKTTIPTSYFECTVAFTPAKAR